MGEFRDHVSKRIIREQWCKPLLQYIHKVLRYKLIYLGLPGPQALDLLNWIEYIDQVIAFQCRDYPKPSSIEQPRDKIVELETRLSDFERQGKLTTFTIYDGYIEEVVLRGRDTNGSFFSQNDVVTVYNLDFCNGITVPLIIKDDSGNTQKLYKSEAIRKLLEIQRDISLHTRCKKFVMFITIHSNFWYKEERRFITQMQDTEINEYISTALASINGRWRIVKLLKAYMFQIIRSFSCHCDFTPEFLPVIYYKGVGKDKENWLMLFTIIGALNKTIAANAPCLQNSQCFLNSTFLIPDSEKLLPMCIRGIKETDCTHDSVDAFKNTECYKQLWLKK